MMKLKLWMLLVFGIICLLCLRCLSWYFVLTLLRESNSVERGTVVVESKFTASVLLFGDRTGSGLLVLQHLSCVLDDPGLGGVAVY